jgi:hypothetical protein
MIETTGFSAKLNLGAGIRLQNFFYWNTGSAVGTESQSLLAAKEGLSNLRAFSAQVFPLAHGNAPR